MTQQNKSTGHRYEVCFKTFKVLRLVLRSSTLTLDLSKSYLNIAC